MNRTNEGRLVNDGDEEYVADAPRRRLENAVWLVRSWEPLLGQAPQPAPGSPLAADDATFPALPTSATAWYAITSALDHLSFGADTLTAEGVTVRRPHAFHTLMRSALMAASQALWVLSGDSTTRTTRSLLVVSDEAKHQTGFLKTLADDQNIMAVASDEYRERIREDLSVLAQRRQAIRAELCKRGVQSKFETTRVIKDVAREIGPGDPWFQRGLLEQWMRGSAAAHARGWVLHYREVEESADGEVQQYTTSESELAELYTAPTGVLSDALSRWWELTASTAS